MVDNNIWDVSEPAYGNHSNDQTDHSSLEKYDLKPVFIIETKAKRMKQFETSKTNKFENSNYEKCLFGFYTQRERMRKIKKYKNKVKKFKLENKLCGRSIVARTIERFNGRFCSKSQHESIIEKSKFGTDEFFGIMTDEEVIKRNTLIDQYSICQDMNNLVKLAIQ